MKRVRMSIRFLICLLWGTAIYGQEPTEPASDSAVEATTRVTIPDGTSVQIRFTEAIWGMGGGFHSRRSYSHPGQQVHIVVAEDLSLNGKVLLRKGSPGQATITDVWMPDVMPNGIPEMCTCVAIRVDWVKSIDGENIVLRATEKPNLKAEKKATSLWKLAGSVESGWKCFWM